jgi:hypothetical protein
MPDPVQGVDRHAYTEAMGRADLPPSALPNLELERLPAPGFPFPVATSGPIQLRGLRLEDPLAHETRLETGGLARSSTRPEYGAPRSPFPLRSCGKPVAENGCVSDKSR